MRSLFVPLKLATNARHLDFVTDLDENIDRVRLLISCCTANGFLTPYRLPDVQRMKLWVKVQP